MSDRFGAPFVLIRFVPPYGLENLALILGFPFGSAGALTAEILLVPWKGLDENLGVRHIRLHIKIDTATCPPYGFAQSVRRNQ
jgi:hypothetical protein